MSGSRPSACVMKRAWQLSSALLLLVHVSKVEAFRLPVNFKQAAAVGGSGGRYFTGSPSDHYTCKVCHAGAQDPAVTVEGVPVDGYIPGQAYRIVIDWDDALASVALNVEMTDDAGRALGQFSSPAPDQLAPGDRCTAGNPAVIVVSGAERTLAIMADCGAHQATLLWTSPPATIAADGNLVAPDAWFSGSLLAGNKDDTIDGDGVADISRVFGPSGQPATPTTQITAGCDAVPRAPAPPGCGLIAVVGLVFSSRMRRRRTARS